MTITGCASSHDRRNRQKEAEMQTTTKGNNGDVIGVTYRTTADGKPVTLLRIEDSTAVDFSVTHIRTEGESTEIQLAFETVDGTKTVDVRLYGGIGQMELPGVYTSREPVVLDSYSQTVLHFPNWGSVFTFLPRLITATIPALWPDVVSRETLAACLWCDMRLTESHEDLGEVFVLDDGFADAVSAGIRAAESLLTKEREKE